MAISETLRQKIIGSADDRCEYCKSSVQITGTPLVIDHIQAQSLGGSDNEENLAAACYRYNLMKGTKQQGYDSEIEHQVLLFNQIKGKIPHPLGCLK